MSKRFGVPIWDSEEQVTAAVTHGHRILDFTTDGHFGFRSPELGLHKGPDFCSVANFLRISAVAARDRR
jgi:hypothetical protein